MRVNFIHLDLGLGGAERLVVDAACALKLRGHEVTILTSHHDPDRSFEETMPALDGLLSRDIRCLGDWIPRHALGGRFHLFFAVARMAYVSFWLANKNKPDVIFVDQVSFIVPLLRLLAPGVPVLFYCHYPDKLLAPPSRSLLRKLYRLLFDFAEEITTANADTIVVNSKFTSTVVAKYFPVVTKSHKLEVLYPAVDLKSFDDFANSTQALKDFNNMFNSQPLLRQKIKDGNYVLSINRFERKKSLDLALRALLKTCDPNAFLVVTGGYDVRVQENVEYLAELKILARDLKIEDRVFFVPSCSAEEKQVLLDHCRVLVYTPQNEHFGIVPLEAAACRKPVVACNSGGPLETIVSGVTGFLVEPDAESFAKALDVFFEKTNGKMESSTMGTAARQRVSTTFAREAFGENLESLLEKLIQTNSKRKANEEHSISTALSIVALVLIAGILVGYIMVMMAFFNRDLHI